MMSTIWQDRLFLLQAPIAVGLTALSSEDMYMAAGHGRCVEIFHVIGDTLCQLGKPPTRPDLGPPNIEDSADKSRTIETDNQQANLDENEILPVKLNQLDIGEDLNEMTKDEILSEVVSYRRFIK